MKRVLRSCTLAGVTAGLLGLGLDPLPSGSLETIGSAASSPSHVWLFGNDSSIGPFILSHS